MSIPRRRLLAAGPLALAGCGQDRDPYFGSTVPPTGQRLVFEIGAEPTTLDPAQTGYAPGEQYILPALFEGLTANHPITAEPMAALATHYEVAPDGTRYTFFLRGHPNPRGTRLPSGDDLPIEFTRGRTAAPSATPARWSDGRPITSHDFVYSWRRVADPATAAPWAHLLYDLRNCREITAGKLAADRLGVRATDDFTLEVELTSSAPYFFQMTPASFLAAVPMQAIEASGALWTDPRHIVTSGPFRLADWRARDLVRVVRNPNYYDATYVTLDEIQFVPFGDMNTLLHYYRAGEAQSTASVYSPLMPTLHAKRDFRTHPMFGLKFCVFNAGKPPFDNPLVRYAFNMALDKGMMARWKGLGQVPARTLVPPLKGYTAPRSLPVKLNGRSFDVLAFDPAGARELLRAAAFDFEQSVEFLTSTTSDALIEAEILRSEWSRHLGVKVRVVAKEFSVFVDAYRSHAFNGICDSWDCGLYIDPNWFLSRALRHEGRNGGWANSKYTAMLTNASATTDPVERMSKLAECETYLLTAMPIIPLWYDAWSYFQKPYVRGCGGNVVDSRQFKYTWIDSNWRPPS